MSYDQNYIFFSLEDGRWIFLRIFHIETFYIALNLLSGHAACVPHQHLLYVKGVQFCNSFYVAIIPLQPFQTQCKINGKNQIKPIKLLLKPYKQLVRFEQHGGNSQCPKLFIYSICFFFSWFSHKS